MAKGDDIKLRKKNKAIRKKLAKDSSSVSTRVASLIAAKKRRQSGKRRKCQGMCFSLPTPEDPFNERVGKEPISTKKDKKRTSKGMLCDDQVKSDTSKPRRLKKTHSVDNSEKEEDSESFEMEEKSVRPSMFLFSCLEFVRDFLVGPGVFEWVQTEPLFSDSWGIGFWRSYTTGMDVLDDSGCSPSVKQMAWIAATAVDHIAQKENSGISFDFPFLVYLVPSQEKASEVRSVYKPFKSYGIHSVSLHPGASVEHQIQGLRRCEPEFLIATPERLKELVLLKAVDVSGISLLVVDSMDALSHCLDAVKWIKKSINGNHCTVVFQGNSGASSVQATKSILQKPFHTLSFNESEDDLDI